VGSQDRRQVFTTGRKTKMLHPADLIFCIAGFEKAICLKAKRIYNGVGFIGYSAEKEVIQ
jgi:hypothetical protein